MEKIEKLETGVWAMTLDEAPSLIAIIRRDATAGKHQGKVFRVGHPEKVLGRYSSRKLWMTREGLRGVMVKLQEKM